jgi:hypothetical protein
MWEDNIEMKIKEMLVYLKQSSSLPLYRVSTNVFFYDYERGWLQLPVVVFFCSTRQDHADSVSLSNSKAMPQKY